MARMSLTPGFRFHPTDVELIMYYIKRKVMGKKLHFDAVTELNIYQFSPWDLPDKCLLKSKDLEWYFFSPSEKKYGSGARTNRATETGYWKVTGKDRPVIYNQRTVGMIKTLVFHEGRAPKGQRTNWVMYEYRLTDETLVDVVQDAYRLYKIFKKSGLGPKNGAQYGAPFKEEEWSDTEDICVEPSSAACQIFSDCVLISKKSDAVSLTLPRNSAHRSTTEPDPSTDRPLNLNIQTGMEKICAELSSIDSHISYDYVPPSGVQSSAALRIENSSVLGTFKSGLSTVGPPVMDLPSNSSDVPDDEDFDEVLNMFKEDINTPKNNSNKEFEKNGHPNCWNENGIYNGLGNLNDWIELNETGFNILAKHDADQKQMLIRDDTPFLELDDLTSGGPMNTMLQCDSLFLELDDLNTAAGGATLSHLKSH